MFECMLPVLIEYLFGEIRSGDLLIQRLKLSDTWPCFCMVSGSEHYFGGFEVQICCLCWGLRLFSFSAHLISSPVGPFRWGGSASAHWLRIKCFVLYPKCSTLKIATLRYNSDKIQCYRVLGAPQAPSYPRCRILPWRSPGSFQQTSKWES